MLLQLIYMLTGKNLIMLAIVLAAFATVYLLLIYKAGVRVGTAGNLASCAAGLAAPLSAALAVSFEVFRFVFAFRLIVETALVILAAASMLKDGKNRPLGLAVILGNDLFCSAAGIMIPLCIQDPGYWIKTALSVGAFGLMLLISDSDVNVDPIKPSGFIIPGSGDYDYNPQRNPYENDGFTVYDRVTNRTFHYSWGEWKDQDGNTIPSASAHAWGLDDFYNNKLAGSGVTGPIRYGNK